MYDLRGREIRELLRETMPAGAHSVEWDGRDHAGGRMSSGAYIVRMVVGESVETRKVTLAK